MQCGRNISFHIEVKKNLLFSFPNVSPQRNRSCSAPQIMPWLCWSHGSLPNCAPQKVFASLHKDACCPWWLYSFVGAFFSPSCGQLDRFFSWIKPCDSLAAAACAWNSKVSFWCKDKRHKAMLFTSPSIIYLVLIAHDEIYVFGDMWSSRMFWFF